jgi:hypothetical protein
MTSSSPGADTNPVNPHLMLLQERLTALKASELTIHDESHLHAGHAGNQGPQLWLIAFLTGRWLRNIGWCMIFCAI